MNREQLSATAESAEGNGKRHGRSGSIRALQFLLYKYPRTVPNRLHLANLDNAGSSHHLADGTHAQKSQNVKGTTGPKGHGVIQVRV